jgi:hypothetical protein
VLLREDLAARRGTPFLDGDRAISVAAAGELGQLDLLESGCVALGLAGSHTPNNL